MERDRSFLASLRNTRQFETFYRRCWRRGPLAAKQPIYNQLFRFTMGAEKRSFASKFSIDLSIGPLRGHLMSLASQPVVQGCPPTYVKKFKFVRYLIGIVVARPQISLQSERHCSFWSTCRTVALAERRGWPRGFARWRLRPWRADSLKSAGTGQRSSRAAALGF